MILESLRSDFLMRLTTVPRVYLSLTGVSLAIVSIHVHIVSVVLVVGEVMRDGLVSVLVVVICLYVIHLSSFYMISSWLNDAVESD